MQEVFLSRPTWIDQSRAGGLDNFIRLLKAHDLNPRTIGTTDYPNKAPLDEVISLMEECAGAIILGYPQTVATVAILKGNPISKPLILPTEWNHIEAGLAYARRMPLLVIHDIGVSRGIFDRGAISSFIYEIDLSDASWPLKKEVQGALESWKKDLHRKVEKDQSTPVIVENNQQNQVLSPEHVATLVRFAESAEPQSRSGVATALKVSEQKAQLYLDELSDRGLIAANYNLMYGTRYMLSKAGRKQLAILKLI